MGKLRLISKKFRASPTEHQKYREMLDKARDLADDHIVTWEPDPGEDTARARKCFLFVAEREGIDLKITRPRGKDYLRLSFRKPAKQKPLTPDQYRERILKVLRDHGKPMKRIDILQAGELPAAGWHRRIRDLLAEGRIVKSGKLINTIYALPE